MPEILTFIIVVLLIQASIFGFFCAYLAGEKNRGQSDWFWLGFIFSFVALLVLMGVPSRRALAVSTSGSASISDITRKCPFCAETIKAQAILCRYCGHEVEAVMVTPENPAQNNPHPITEAVTPSDSSTLSSSARRDSDEYAQPIGSIDLDGTWGSLARIFGRRR
jgi:hypothetical protein